MEVLVSVAEMFSNSVSQLHYFSYLLYAYLSLTMSTDVTRMVSEYK